MLSHGTFSGIYKQFQMPMSSTTHDFTDMIGRLLADTAQFTNHYEDCFTIHFTKLLYSHNAYEKHLLIG